MRIASLFLAALFAAGCAVEPESNTSPSIATPAPLASASPSPEAPAVNQGSAPQKNVTLNRPGDSEPITSNPFTISGTARTFENNVSIRIRDQHGRTILETYATATGELGEFSPWEREVLLTSHPGDRVTIDAFESSAKDGSVQSLVSRIVRFDVAPRTITLYVHDPERAPDDCTRVFPLRRELPSTQALARALLDALIREPGSTFPAGSAVNRVAIRDGVAEVDFNERLQNVGGSCRAQAIRASVERTLGELPNVDRVSITAGGSSSLALQP